MTTSDRPLRVNMVLLHPIGLDGDCWQFLHRDILSNAVAYDLPGHGSRSAPGCLSLDAFAADVVQHVPGLLDIVGLSMGGAVAQRIAVSYPERVRSVVIACSSLAGGADRSHLLMERAAATEKLGMAGTLQMTLTRWFSPAALRRGSHPGVAYATARLLADDPANIAATWRALAHSNGSSELGDVRAPTTVLHAQEDAASSVADKLRIASRIPDSRLDIISGPHMAALERPEDFSAALLRHLSWLADRQSKSEGD